MKKASYLMILNRTLNDGIILYPIPIRNCKFHPGRLCLWIVIGVLFVLNIIVLVIMINNGGKLYRVGHTFGMGYHTGYVSCLGRYI